VISSIWVWVACSVAIKPLIPPIRIGTLTLQKV
jgi:hypothetical protein